MAAHLNQSTTLTTDQNESSFFLKLLTKLPTELTEIGHIFIWKIEHFKDHGYSKITGIREGTIRQYIRRGKVESGKDSDGF